MNRIENKQGMTVIEMLVAIAIFTLGIGGFSLLFIKTWESKAVILEKGMASMMASESENKITKNLREATRGVDGSYPLKSGSDFELIFFADIDNDSVVERVHYYLDGLDLKMGITDPTGSPAIYPEADEDVRILTKNVINEVSDPIFYFYSENYFADPDASLLQDPIDMQKVRVVGVDLLIRGGNKEKSESVRIKSIAKIRNVGN